MSSNVTYLSREARTRYANYALSVVMSRALPDVRDGLKPVQRRILYTMFHDLKLTPDAKHRKSAKIVGDVMGSYHPHGDMSIYDAMVRMAQSWVMRAPLVDGQGNFGSPDDDGPAAYRYTEAKLRPIAVELLAELGQETVSFKPNFEGTTEEPLVLPARFPNLLVNGSQGIAVGMATSIPPHNLGEIIDACVAEIDAPKPLTTKELLKFVKGPDFPTGATLQATKDDLAAIYETGSGTLRLRGEYRTEERKNGAVDIVITAVPYAISRKDIVEKVADIIINKKLPPLLDVRDESTGEVRIVLEVKKGTDPALVMAYLFKHTPLQTSVAINLTCLVPAASEEPPAVAGGAGGWVAQSEPDDRCVPTRLGLGAMIRHFLDFRMETVRRRIAYDLAELQRRLHLLDGFVIIFDALDEAVKIIRKADGRAEAKEKLIARFHLSELQTDAILELRLYKLASLEILSIRKELDQKKAEAKKLDTLLRSDTKRWDLIKGELTEIKQKYGEKRRTRVVGATGEPEFAAEDFIIDEDANVILTTQGWVKRVREVKDLSTTRVREGDSVLSVVAGSTRASVAFFSSFGACYVARINDIPATTGYGEPIQKFFKLDDGERILACMSFDPRVLAVPESPENGEPVPPYVIVVTKGGLGFRAPLSNHRDPSTKSGRKYAKLNDGDEVLLVAPVGDRDGILMVSSDGAALGVMASEVSILSGVGKGTMLIKLDEGERAIGAMVAVRKSDGFTVETEKAREVQVSFGEVLGSRGARGEMLVKKDRFKQVVLAPPTLPSLVNN